MGMVLDCLIRGVLCLPLYFVIPQSWIKTTAIRTQEEAGYGTQTGKYQGQCNLLPSHNYQMVAT